MAAVDTVRPDAPPAKEAAGWAALAEVLAAAAVRAWAGDPALAVDSCTPVPAGHPPSGALGAAGWVPRHSGPGGVIRVWASAGAAAAPNMRRALAAWLQAVGESLGDLLGERWALQSAESGDAPAEGVFAFSWSGATDRGAAWLWLEAPLLEACLEVCAQLPGRAAGADPFPPFAAAGEPLAPGQVDLLLDVPLDISVELGRSQRPIRNILALVVGSVLELDRLAGDPVDVLINGRRIARGEVVVVDERFAVRITEILAVEDRVAWLG